MNLEAYGVKTSDSVIGIPLAYLEDKKILLPIINQYAHYLETDSLVIAGSLFFKRYAVLTAAAALDYFGLQQKKVDWLGYATFDSTQFLLFVRDEVKTEIAVCWEEQILSRHLFRLVEIISKECKINKNILWENVAVRLNAVLKRNQTKYPLNHLEFVHSRITQFSPQWIENMDNPIQKYCHLIVTERKTCCRYYQLDKKEEGMDYCLVCPLKK
ncbi:(2Fe-2S)-binding protein [Solibacillus sp. R5-41]|uniref:(2Fe-2S)-binding protein n=1 Tax=Solibacillus sp. R5-41 TaxID=2048654 RepID=UPI0012FD1726|nr:(2Fe-2S)-binding protein [Solibacillus sp. R5-41]